MSQEEVGQANLAAFAPKAPREGALAALGSRLGSRLARVHVAVHLLPYVALAGLCAVLIGPGVIPRGQCDGPSVNTHAFVGWSALAFAGVALLMMASAALASVQRSALTGRSPAAGVIGAVFVAAWAVLAGVGPHGDAASLVVVLMLLGAVAPIPTAIGALAGFVATVFSAVDHPARRRPWLVAVARFAAWATALTVLPAIMLVTYGTASPVCFN